MSQQSLACRVCGFLEESPPWGTDGKTPTFEFCVCCGVEHGYEDCTLDGVRRYRQRWLDGGARWFHPKFIPDNWIVDEQLASSPTDFK